MCKERNLAHSYLILESVPDQHSLKHLKIAQDPKGILFVYQLFAK